MNYITAERIGNNGKEAQQNIHIFEKDIFFSKMHVTVGKKSEIDTTTVFEGKSKVMGKVLDSRIAEATYIAEDILTCVVGFGTYITGETRLENCKIGKYCSIGHRVMTIRGQHPVCDWVAMSPVFYTKNMPLGFSLVKENLFEEYKWIDQEKEYAVEIGNDVWNGDDVRLMERNRIGYGSDQYVAREQNVDYCGAQVNNDQKLR